MVCYDHGEYVYNWDDSEYRREREEEERRSFTNETTVPVSKAIIGHVVGKEWSHVRPIIEKNHVQITYVEEKGHFLIMGMIDGVCDAAEELMKLIHKTQVDLAAFRNRQKGTSRGRGRGGNRGGNRGGGRGGNRGGGRGGSRGRGRGRGGPSRSYTYHESDYLWKEPDVAETEKKESAPMKKPSFSDFVPLE